MHTRIASLKIVVTSLRTESGQPQATEIILYRGHLAYLPSFPVVSSPYWARTLWQLILCLSSSVRLLQREARKKA